MDISKNITLNASTYVSVKQSDGTLQDTVVASYSANVSESYSSSQISIQSQSLYADNKELVRSDKQKFDEYAYKLQDIVFTSVSNSTTTSTPVSDSVTSSNTTDKSAVDSGNASESASNSTNS